MFTENSIAQLLHLINKENFMFGYCLLNPVKIHPGQMPLLCMLSNEDGITQKELATRIHVRPSTVNVMITRLEKNRLVEKHQDQRDQRKSLIYLTDKGKRTVVDIDKTQERIRNAVLKDFTREEQKEMYRLLEKYYRQLAAVIEEEIHERKSEEQ